MYVPTVYAVSYSEDTYHVTAGHIISDWQPLRHFCLEQLRQVWLFLQCNLDLSEEGRSFLIVQAMHRLFEVCKYLSDSISSCSTHCAEGWHGRTYLSV